MNRYLLITAIISALFYTLITLKDRFFSKNMLIIIGGSILIGFFAFKHESFYINKYLFAVLICYMGGVTVFYSKYFLPSFSERILHVISILYSYSIFLNISSTAWIILLLSPMAAVAYYLITTRTIKPTEKKLLYCLFLLMLICIQFFNLKNMALLDLPRDEPPVADYSLILTVFFITGIFFYTFVYFLNILSIIPVQGKDETEEEMKKRIMLQTDLFLKKVKDEQAGHASTIVFTVLAFSFITGNHLYDFLPKSFFFEEAVVFVILADQYKDKIISLASRIKALYV